MLVASVVVAATSPRARSMPASRRVFSLAASPTTTSHFGSSSVRLFSTDSTITNGHGLRPSSRATLLTSRPALHDAELDVAAIFELLCRGLALTDPLPT